MAARHRSISPRSRKSLASRLSYPLLGLLVAVVGLVGFTIVNGELRLPFGDGLVFSFGGEAQAATRLPSGTVAVYGCPRPLPAFTKITREHLLTSEGLHQVPVVEEAIEPNGLFRVGVEGWRKLNGRVLRRDKPVNYAFTESDFLPVGTRPGPSAGIPPGKRGVWLDTDVVSGLTDVQAGDRVDLVAAESLTRSPKMAPNMIGNVIGNVADPVLSTRLQGLAAQNRQGGAARAWVLARQALVVEPMRRRTKASGQRRAGKPPTIIEEVFLAMAPDEVARYSQALALNVAIVAAPRSGQPEATPTEIEDVRPVDPTAEMRRMLFGNATTPASLGMVEVIRGEERGTVTVPRQEKGN
ncbi:MAG: hypothetical protein AAF628_14880 [Planctomycetota bacterium]